MTAVTTRAAATAPLFGAPNLTERLLLRVAEVLETTARRRMLRRQAVAERVAAGTPDPVERRRQYAADAARATLYR